MSTGELATLEDAVTLPTAGTVGAGEPPRLFTPELLDAEASLDDFSESQAPSARIITPKPNLENRRAIKQPAEQKLTQSVPGLDAGVKGVARSP